MTSHDAAKAAAKLGSLGVEETLKALANGQVEVLVVSANMDSIDYSKKKVKKILKEYEPGDDTARQALEKIDSAADIADQLLVRAINTGAKIMFVRDQSLLAARGRGRCAEVQHERTGERIEIVIVISVSGPAIFSTEKCPARSLAVKLVCDILTTLL